MGTYRVVGGLAEMLFSKNRRAVLSLLYGHSDEAFYLRQIVRASGGGVGAIQRELRQLVAHGIIRRDTRGNQVYFQANADCPIFSELKSLLMKTAGVADVLRTALAPLADCIEVAFLYGSIAQGKEGHSSDVDVMVIGDVLFADVVAAIGSAQERLHREINPTVYPCEEFQAKLVAGHHFLNRVTSGSKVFVIGDERGLERLVTERLAD
jgi:predicted nucleotidyltransferase